MNEEKAKLEKIVELLMHENNTLKAALLESERRLDNGLTIRDQFAGLAMQGLISSPTMGDPDLHNSAEEWIKDITETAYEFADAMLKARG